jgi:chromosome partitioning protein
MKKIALVNHKGGVGKTTSSVNIAAAMARQGKRVLLIDTDPQSNLTDSLGIFDSEKTIYHSFSKGEPLPVVRYSDNLHVVPCSLDFAGIEIEISTRLAREKVLQGLLEPLENDYDICIMDCPPSLGIITLNVLVATNEVYIPMHAEYLSFRGIDSIVGIIDQVRKYYNPTLSIKGVFFTQYKPNRVLSREIKMQLEQSIGSILMDSAIRVNVALAEAQSCGKDIYAYDEASPGANDYNSLVNEIISR